MEKKLELYQIFIDSMVQISKNSVNAKRLKKRNYYPENNDELIAFNEFLRRLSVNDAIFVAKLLDEERKSAIHDILAYLDDEIACEDLRIIVKGIEMAVEPYETMHYDFICRCAGDEWPKNESV